MFRKSYLISVLAVVILTAGNTHYAIAQSSQPPSFMNPTFFRSYVGYCGEQRAGRPDPHWGLDITGSVPGQIEGADVFASESGRVRKVGVDKDAGNFIEIDHGNGHVTRYLHLQDNINVKTGQEITRGMTIGYVGRTGEVEGPHLHFEILYLGTHLNPLDFLPNASFYFCRSKTGCPDYANSPPLVTSPGRRFPDETFSVADATFPAAPNLEDAYYRLAIKKGKAVVINYYYFKNLIKERDTYLENLPEGSPPDQVYMDNLEAEISRLLESFGTNQELFWKEYLETPDVAVLQRGFPDGVKSLLGRLQEPVTEISIDFSPQEVIKHHPVLIIPSGGLYGLQASAIFKATLDEYVKSGGTLIVFTQPQGIHFLSIPTSDGESIRANGWDEDINCFFKGAFLNQYHPIVSSLTKSMPNINIDGHMISIPDGATQILTRSSNGQPILALYEHGLGRVVVTTMYTDFAYGVSQAGPDEIAVVRDMVAWAKSPTVLPEVRPNEMVPVTVTVENNTSVDAASVKLQTYDPDRKNLLKEELISGSIPAGSSLQFMSQYPTITTSPLGIYHIDYTLLDSAGNIIQPRAEADNGRFVVSSPPEVGYEGQGITFEILTDAEAYISGELVTFTIRINNHSTTERTVRVEIYGSQPQTVTIAPGGVGIITYTTGTTMIYVSYYDETGASLGTSYKIPVVYSPSANVNLTTDKTIYAKNETLTINTTLKNNIPASWQPFVKTSIKDPYYRTIFEDTKTVSLTPFGTSSIVNNFTLSMIPGTYNVVGEAWFGTGPYGRWHIYTAFSRFEVFQSQISVAPNLPSAFSSGTNTIPFTLTNTGKVNVNSGILDVGLKDPDGITVYSGNHAFSIAVGESKTLNVPITIPPLKFGNYTLTYSQSDETRTGNPTNVTIPNTTSLALSLDKSSYRLRETANLTVNLTNTGEFSLENMLVSASAPDAGYSDTRTVSLLPNQNSQMYFSILIPDSVTAGQHNVDLTVSLSSGSSFTKSMNLTVPESKLVIGYSGTTSTFRGGDTINLVVENIGGVDTTYATDVLSIVDNKGVTIFQRSVTGNILAGEKKSLIDIQIPYQAVNGGAFLNTWVKDTNTGRMANYFKPIEIVGLTATLQARTDKEAYFKTEAIAGISNLVNGPFGIEEGSLKVAVNRIKSTSHFLPKEGWVGFRSPSGIAVGSDGSVYVADSGVHRVQKFDSDGNFILKWGVRGSGGGKFYRPDTLAVGPDGSVYVAVQVYYVEDYNYLIEKYDSNGNFINSWGGWGSGDGEIENPQGIAVTADGSVYVADTRNHRIQKFDPDGNFIMKWGTGGSGEGQFGYPYGIAIGPDGSFYVADTGNKRIQKFDSNVNFITKWGTKGSKDGQFDYPYDVAVGPDGSIYVADTENNRIQKFDKYGNFIAKWGGRGSEDGQFYSPQGIAVGPDGSVYVVDSCNDWDCNNRIQKFDNNGNFITKWGDYGSGDGQFYSPSGVAVGPDGSVYVSDGCSYWDCNNRIQKFDPYGNFITAWGSSGTDDGQFDYPSGIAVSPDGFIYIVDTYNHRIQKFDRDGNFLAKWGSSCMTDSNYDGIPDQPCDGQFNYPAGITIDPEGYVYVTDAGNNRIQKFDSSGIFIMTVGKEGIEDEEYDWPNGIAVGPDGIVYVADTGNDRIQRYIAEVLFETTIPINQPANTTQDYNTDIGILNATGKLYLQATLKNSLGQTIAHGVYPFYIYEGNTALLFNIDKKVYRPGETVVITGQIKNLATIEAENLVFSLNSKLNAQSSKLLYTETFTVPAGGNQPFTVTTTANAEGTVTLTGNVSQNNSTLVEIMDKYEVANPNVSVAVTVADIVGNELFPINVEIKNVGKVEATIQFGVQSSEWGDSQTITIPAGETKLIQYQQQISQDTDFIFTFTGDLEKTITKTLDYGLAANIAVNPQNLYPEGNVAVPITITNTGQLAETIEVNFLISPVSVQSSKTYYLPVGTSTTDTLYSNLPEGNYQITASSQLPLANAQATFSVRKENKVEMALSLGAQSDGVVPVNINLTNIGFNTIEGSVQLSVINSQGTTIWGGSQDVSLPYSSTPVPSTQIFYINPSALQSGDYTLKAELLNNSSQFLSYQSSNLTVKSPSFQITQIPSYQVFYPGQEAIFTFMVKNSGNQEGPFELRFRAYDMIDSTQREWLKPGEEKAITFGFKVQGDLEERDYFANYELKDQGSGARGQVKYHVSGVNLTVNASLDKSYYNEGETAHLILNIQSPNPNQQPLFARINYTGYEPQQPFTLNGSQTLTFDIPLPQITGEKLFYGIYHESGRSIHLNSLYIHKAGDVITITTDKQVYNPGETVSVSVTGNVSGNITLSGPGGYEEAFAFSGQATKSFTLPSAMTAGTYFINATLEASNPGTITTSHPFDVAGIQVNIVECKNDKGKYASVDTIATNLSISSNTTMPATLKTWIVYPDGQYSLVGENSINLSSSENLLINLNSSLNTSISGIHQLTYGIFTGELLLVSGSEAFDVGDAVLLGLSTDKTDYSEPNETVNVKVSMYGTVSATLEFFLDGQPAASLPVSLTGFSSFQYTLPAVTPGPHILKAVLTAGGLTSTKETTFIYGSVLPDLTVQIYKDQTIEQSTLNLTITATNQGKSDAGPTSLSLYDGQVTPEKLLATLSIQGLPKKGAQTFTYSLNLLGRAGSNTIYAVIDPNNLVYEFNETNNESQITFSVPAITLSTSLEKDIYPLGDTVTITSLITNLSKDQSAGVTLTTSVKDASGLLVFTNSQDTSPIPGMATVTVITPWPTDLNLPGGIYTIQQAIEGSDAKTQKTITLKLDKDFTITSDVTIQKIETGEMAQYNLTLTSLRGFTGEVSLSIQDCPSGFTASFALNPVTLSDGVAQTLLQMIPTGQVRSGSYSVKVNATGGGRSHDITLMLDLTDFQMAIIPITQTVKQLSEAIYTITLNPINGFDSNVTLEVNGVPRGMRANLSANQVTLPRVVTLSLSTSKWLLAGAYNISISAKGRVVNHETAATLVVHKNPELTPGIVTAPGPLNKPIIHTFQFDGELMSEFQVFDSRRSVSIASGDVDGDGIDETIAGTSWKLLRTPALLGIFRRNGTPVTLMETEYRSRFGLTVATGDIDGDWVEDIAVGFYDTGQEDDEEDGFDGWDDFKPNCHHPRGHGGVKIYQIIGQRFIDTGLILYPYEKEGYRGSPSIAIADVDGDGVPELITAPGPDPCAPAKIKVFKIDMKEGIGRWNITSLLAEFTVVFEEKKAGFGANIAAGDIDGDGKAEIIIGAGPDPRNRSMVKVYRGDGTFTGIQFIAYPDQDKRRSEKEHDREEGLWNRFGVYVAVGDMEMDGISEIITGMGPGPMNEGWVRVFKGDGTPMGNGFLAYPKNMKFGVRVSGGNIGE